MWLTRQAQRLLLRLAGGDVLAYCNDVPFELVGAKFTRHGGIVFSLKLTSWGSGHLPNEGWAWVVAAKDLGVVVTYGVASAMYSKAR